MKRFVYFALLFCNIGHLQAPRSASKTQTFGRRDVSYGVGVELDGRRVFAAADAAVSFDFAAEDLPPPVELGVGPVALCLCRADEQTHLQQRLGRFVF